jgi:iron complex transport system permease protein
VKAIVFLLAAVGIVFVLELSLGTVGIPFQDVLRALVSGRTGSIHANIIWNVRLPRALTAMSAGASLACSGLVLQTVFRNPLAGPWVLGITSGAELGAAAVVLAGAAAGLRVLEVSGYIGMAGGAFAGALLIVLLLGRVARNISPVALLILGLMIQYVAEALIGFALQFFSENQIDAFAGFRDASFHQVTPDQVRVLLPVAAFGLALAFLMIKSLNALLLGERYSSSIGLNVRRVRRTALFTTVVLSGIVTAFCGPVRFLDIAVPHLGRGFTRSSDHRVLLPAVGLMGALIALTADLLVNLPWSKHFLHLNYATALIGIPVVFWILLHNRGVLFASTTDL